MSGADTDRFGLTHAHFQQLHQGVPVWGGMTITHLDSRGQSLPVTTDGLYTGIRVSTNPTVDAASAIALATLELSPRGPLGAEPKAELVTVLDNPLDGLAYTDFILDARTGQVLEKWNSLKTMAAVGRGRSQYSGEVQLNVWKNAEGLYELRDTTRAYGEGMRTYDANHTAKELTLYTDPDNTWGDGANYIDGADTLSDNGQTAAVDAHFGLQASSGHDR